MKAIAAKPTPPPGSSAVPGGDKVPKLPQVKKALTPTSHYIAGRLPARPHPANPPLNALLALRPKSRSIARLFGNVYKTPRLTKVYMRDYEFPGSTPAEELPAVLEPLLDWANAHVAAPGEFFNGAVLNWYMDGSDYIYAHADKTAQLVPGSPIFSASFGETRTFRIREMAMANTGAVVEDIPVSDGTYIVMCGDMQKEFKHELATNPDANTGPRVNVTFRMFAEPTPARKAAPPKRKTAPPKRKAVPSKQKAAPPKLITKKAAAASSSSHARARRTV